MVEEAFVSKEIEEWLLSHNKDWDIQYQIVNGNRCHTQQSVMRWLRETYLFHICACPKQLEEGVVWKVNIYDEDCDIAFSFSSAMNKEVEEAYEAAIKYCLEKLIK